MNGMCSLSVTGETTVSPLRFHSHREKSAVRKMKQNHAEKMNPNLNLGSIPGKLRNLLKFALCEAVCVVVI